MSRIAIPRLCTLEPILLAHTSCPTPKFVCTALQHLCIVHQVRDDLVVEIISQTICFDLTKIQNSTIFMTRLTYFLLTLSVGSFYVVIKSFLAHHAEIGYTGSESLAQLGSALPKPRPWSPYHYRNGSIPCYPRESDWNMTAALNSPTSQGFLFAKPYKVGSSTAVGVHLRVAGENCHVRFGHGPTQFPAHYLFRDRIRSQSFLWTMLREPTSRWISQFFHFQVSRRGVTPSIESLHDFLSGKKDYYLQALLPSTKFKRSTHDPLQAIDRMMEEYDFIAVLERMEESMVVLSLLLDIPLSRFLYLKAKTQGGYDAQRKCTYIVPTFLDDKMEAFLQSDAWHDQVKYDTTLYKIVNASLDQTIEQVGKDRFLQRLSRFREAQQAVEKKCRPRAIFPCDENGRFHQTTDCLWKDSGCGQACVDQVALELRLDDVM